VPEDSFEDRTEAPSSKRRRDAREKGNVAKSTEINSVLVLLMGIVALRVMSPWLFKEMSWCINHSFQMISHPVLNQNSFLVYSRNALIIFLKLSLPVAVVILFAGVLANIIQVGFLFTAEPLTPKFERINPISGLQRMFSMRSIVEVIKSIVKMAIIATVAYLTLKGRYQELILLGDTTIGAFWVFILKLGFTLVFRIALVLIILALLDYGYQRFEHEKQLKMTRYEVKEERKQLEGDPMVKARIRSLQREMARRRMMEEVPKATVVVTNPTTLAIAIRYEQTETEAPVVVAKGKHLIAQRIKEIAVKESIPVVEDKPLARAMYDQAKIGQQIPVEFYNAVAEILAYVYKLKHKAAA